MCDRSHLRRPAHKLQVPTVDDVADEMAVSMFSFELPILPDKERKPDEGQNEH
jgi:hypothetical protein